MCELYDIILFGLHLRGVLSGLFHDIQWKFSIFSKFDIFHDRILDLKHLRNFLRTNYAKFTMQWPLPVGFGRPYQMSSVHSFYTRRSFRPFELQLKSEEAAGLDKRPARRLIATNLSVRTLFISNCYNGHAGRNWTLQKIQAMAFLSSTSSPSEALARSDRHTAH